MTFRQMRPPPASILLVQVEPWVAILCRSLFPNVLSHRVADRATAIERLPITRPIVVVVGGEFDGAAIEDIADPARRIGTEIVRVTATTSRGDIEHALVTAVARRQRR